MFNKRAVSTVIATVLIILLTITAVGILAAVVIPFVQNNLDESSSCSDVRGQVTIVRDKSCYEDTINTEENPHKFTKVTVKLSNADIDGLYFVLEDSEPASFGSRSYEFEQDDVKHAWDLPITDNDPDLDDDGEINEKYNLDLPKRGGGEEEYLVLIDENPIGDSNIIDGDVFFREVRVGAMIRGKRCPNPDVAKLNFCI